jgi:hypothetical protein
VSARLFNASRADSSRSWCDKGDRPGHQESAFSFRTLPVKGEAGLVVAEVEPPPLPLSVVGGHRTGNVKFPAQLQQRNRHATSAHRAAHPRLRRGERV